MSDKPKAEQLWHSALVQMGEVPIIVKSEPKSSQYPDPKRAPYFNGDPKPPIIYLEIDGKERLLKLENQNCSAFFQGQKGRCMVIKAEGDRENAIIRHIRDAAPPAPTNGHGHHAPARSPQVPAPTSYQPHLSQAPQVSPAHMPPPIPPQQPQPTTAPVTAPAGAPPPLPQQAPATAPENRQAGNAPLAPGLQEAGEPAQQQANGGKRHMTPEERQLMKTRAWRDVSRHARRISNAWLLAFAEAMYCREQVKKQFNSYELNESQFQGCNGSILIQLEYDGKHKLMPLETPDLRSILEETTDESNPEQS